MQTQNAAVVKGRGSRKKLQLRLKILLLTGGQEDVGIVSPVSS